MFVLKMHSMLLFHPHGSCLGRSGKIQMNVRLCKCFSANRRGVAMFISSADWLTESGYD